MNLYLVELKGIRGNSVSMDWGRSYVVAPDATAAYDRVRLHLDTNDIGFERDREMQTVTLLAKDHPYNSTNTMLYL